MLEILYDIIDPHLYVLIVLCAIIILNWARINFLLIKIQLRNFALDKRLILILKPIVVAVIREK